MQVLVEVRVEQGKLDGVAMVFKDYGRRIRMMFDPRRIAEAVALSLLRLFIPRLTDSVPVVRAHV